MGRRRIRCLNAIGIFDISGFDKNSARANDVRINQNIKLLQDLNGLKNFDLILICTPPNWHEFYLKLCIASGVAVFVEASVINDELDEILVMSKQTGVPIIPSSTLTYHPAIMSIKKILEEETYGGLRQGVYHSGNYLPDWHPYEAVGDYYVSNKLTGGAREIVPFELTWIVDCLGKPTNVFGNFRKLISIEGAEEIDDTYNLILEYPKANFFLAIDVIAQPADRSLTLILDHAVLTWNWENNFIEVKLRNFNTKKIEFELGLAETGYNPNITEKMYIDEIRSIIQFLEGNHPQPYTMEQDIYTLSLLSDLESKYVNSYNH